MKIGRIAALLTTAVIVPALAQSHPGPQPQTRFAITTDQVALAIAGKGIPAQTVQVSLLANVVASDAHPQLDILSVEPFGDRNSGRSLIKLACHEPRVCIPFYAVATETVIDGLSDVPKAVLTVSSLKSASTIALRAGTRATLVMEDERTHIQVAVIALENGVVGRTIRVASPDHKQFYNAEVVSPTLLRRSF